jgi:hypothetical protein
MQSCTNFCSCPDWPEWPEAGTKTITTALTGEEDSAMFGVRGGQMQLSGDNVVITYESEGVEHTVTYRVLPNEDRQ